MTNQKLEKMNTITTLENLVRFLCEELNWPIKIDNFENLHCEPESIKNFRISPKYSIIAQSPLKQLKIITANQPWGIFFIEFEPKKLPLTILRRIVNSLIIITHENNHRLFWQYNNFLFISIIGESSDRHIAIAMSSNLEGEEKPPLIKIFSQNNYNFYLHYLQTEVDLNYLVWPNDPDNVEAWKNQWQQAFYLKPRKLITSSRELAFEMAKITKEIKEHLKWHLEYETESDFLYRELKNLQKTIIHDVDIETFSDIYAQTIVYGLFSARVLYKEEFDFAKIKSIIQFANPFLGFFFDELFKSANIRIIEELGIIYFIELLKKTDIETILKDFRKEKADQDLIIHFYELFLHEYRPELKELRGVYYTPDPVVIFIVKAINELIQSKLGMNDGLIDESVNEQTHLPELQILDPATGTGTFLFHILIQMKLNFEKKYENISQLEREEKWNLFIKNQFLHKITGIELLLVPYTITHLKLGLKLKEYNYHLMKEDKLQLFLSDTLQGPNENKNIDFHANKEVEESQKVEQMIFERKYNIIIGNPPYNKISPSSKWLNTLLDRYRSIEGEKIKEKKRWFDIYTRFIRFGEWKINDSGYGILGFITNNTYLDAPTLNAMRYNLMKSFDEIYIINLHGQQNAKLPPNLEKDENVFAITKGVAIGIFVKFKKNQNFEKIPSIIYYDLWCSRKFKFDFLTKHSLSELNYTLLNPVQPFYLFIPINSVNFNIYNSYISLTEIFNLNTSGIVTSRDQLVISLSKNKLIDNIKLFMDKNLSNQEIRNKFSLGDNQDWKLNMIRKEFVLINKTIESHIIEIEYRPFERRYIFYHPDLVFRTRPDNCIMTSMLLPNIALCIPRNLTNPEFNHILVTNRMIEMKYSSNNRNTHLFPLFIYNIPKNETEIIKNLNFVQNYSEKNLNLTTFILKEFKELLSDESFRKEEYIFYYCIGILHSNLYRRKFSEFIKNDFARIPIPGKKELFLELSEKGREISRLYIQTTEDVIFIENEIIANDFAINYDKNNGKLQLTDIIQIPMPKDIYNFQIGGYNIISKWLGSGNKGEIHRKDFPLFKNTYDGIIRLRDEISKLKKHIEEIDKIILKYGTWPFRGRK